MLEYGFMRRALFVGIMLSIALPIIGTTLVLKRFSAIGDALSHSSLAGVAAGLIMNINPVLGAVLSCVIASFSLEFIRKRIEQYTEVSIVIITSLGIGIAGILSDFVRNANSFSSFLFGSIVSISDWELFLVTGIALLVIFACIFLYKELFYLVFDEEGAKITGLNTSLINSIFIIVTALAVSISSRTIGSLLVSSVLVIPTASAMQISKSYLSTIIISILYCMISVILGISFSFYLGIKPGATIAVILVILFFITALCKQLKVKK